LTAKTQRDKITLRVDLKGVALNRFLALKEYYGLENDTELVRILISSEYQRKLVTMEDITVMLEARGYLVEADRACSVCGERLYKQAGREELWCPRCRAWRAP